MPITLTPAISHLQLPQAFARVKENQNIWVYNNSIIIEGSPFNSSGDVAEMLCLNVILC